MNFTKISKIFLFLFIFFLSLLFAQKSSFYDWEIIKNNELRKENKELSQDLANQEKEKEIKDKEEVVGLPKNLDQEKKEEMAEKEEAERQEEQKNIILFEVPFLAQAPFGEWDDSRQQDGCEEASVFTAMLWVEGRKEITKEEAKAKILEISEYELEKYGSYKDTSASSTVARIFNDYFEYKNVRVEYDIVVEDVIVELEKGNLVIAPFNGQILDNPYYTAPGPDRHMLVIIGYDYDTEEFITNDPGTRQGEKFRYKKDVLYNSLRDYPTGNGLPIVSEIKAIIIVFQN